MKYYIIVGEASGDLHASELMKEIKHQDKDAIFRFWGGDNMLKEGGTLVKHYKESAYMGFITVIKNIKQIMNNISYCNSDIKNFSPDVLILVDYAGFNLQIAKEISKDKTIKIVYYIPPKLWAWKEGRIKSIKKYIDKTLCILPFEKEYFQNKHNYNVTYVGNPTINEVDNFREEKAISKELFIQKYDLDNRPIIAILCGSRKQEIAANLPIMLRSCSDITDFQIVIAGAPGIDNSFYNQYIDHNEVKIINNDTYNLLHNSHTALVTSGTATLETALFGIPQIVCYHISWGLIIKILRKFFLKIKYVSLVNLIAKKEVVRELIGSDMNSKNLSYELNKVINDERYRSLMKEGYQDIRKTLGEKNAAYNTAKEIINLIKHQR